MKSFAEFLRLDILYIVPMPSIFSKYHRFHGTCVNSILFKNVGKVRSSLGQFALNSQTFISITYVNIIYTAFYQNRTTNVESIEGN
jgi:hypothetical protein